MKVTWDGNIEPKFTYTAIERKAIVAALEFAVSSGFMFAAGKEVLTSLLKTHDQIDAAIEAMERVRKQ